MFLCGCFYFFCYLFFKKMYCIHSIHIFCVLNISKNNCKSSFNSNVHTIYVYISQAINILFAIHKKNRKTKQTERRKMLSMPIERIKKVEQRTAQFAFVLKHFVVHFGIAFTNYRANCV